MPHSKQKILSCVRTAEIRNCRSPQRAPGDTNIVSWMCFTMLTLDYRRAEDGLLHLWRESGRSTLTRSAWRYCTPLLAKRGNYVQHEIPM